MVEWLLSVAEGLAREVEARAREAGRDRSEFVSQLLRVGLDNWSRPATKRSQRSSRANRARRRTPAPIWPCPGHWDVVDALVSRAEELLAAQPDTSRDDLEGALTEAVSGMRADDPAGVVSRALDRVLGRPGNELARDLPGGAANRPPE